MPSSTRVRTLCNNCYLIDNTSELYCQSYDTVVGMYLRKNDKIVLGRQWDCTRTTLKHIKLFLAMFIDEPLTKKIIDKMIEDGKIEYCDMLD